MLNGLIFNGSKPDASESLASRIAHNFLHDDNSLRDARCSLANNSTGDRTIFFISEGDVHPSRCNWLRTV